jgi:hypothetical protein
LDAAGIRSDRTTCAAAARAAGLFFTGATLTISMAKSSVGPGQTAACPARPFSVTVPVSPLRPCGLKSGADLPSRADGLSSRRMLCSAGHKSPACDGLASVTYVNDRSTGPRRRIQACFGSVWALRITQPRPGVNWADWFPSGPTGSG